MKQIDTGGLSFAEIRRRDKYYVDKSMLIADILLRNDSGVYLFTRPRRFGKTTNLTMLDAFLNMKYEGNTWFDGLEISSHHEFDRYRNAFPVIYVDLKGTKSPDYEGFLAAMRSVILKSLKEHLYLLDSPVLTKDESLLFDRLFENTADREDLKSSVAVLSGILERYHGRKVVVLIDEYDRAVSDAFGSRSHRPMMDFLGEFLNAALKSNDSLQMAYITGVMQIAKESIFSDLNNIAVNNIFSRFSDERFGFTEAEVKQILSDYGHPERFEEAKQWYDGYRFGDAEVYNPYSIMCYVSEGFEPTPHWANSGGDRVVRWLLERISDVNFTSIAGLVTGGSFETELYPAIAFEDVSKGSDITLYSLMAMSGYLKAVPVGDDTFEVSIPNEEVRRTVDRLMKSMNPIDTLLFADFSRAVLDGDADRMATSLRRILTGGNYQNMKENGYEAILMTVLWSLSRRYEVGTERDAGNGRTDIFMRPKTAGAPPLIMELKVADSKKDLDRELDRAFGQIHDRSYYAGLPGKVVLIAIAFYVKTPKVRVEVIDNGPDGFGCRPSDRSP